MDINFYISVAVSAGVGSAVVQLLVQLFVSHWLQKNFYSFTLEKADKRNCADRIIELINSKYYRNWLNLNDDIYHRAYKLSDKLLSLGEKSYSECLDKYVSAQRYAQEILRKIQTENFQSENGEEFVKSQHEVDTIRNKLIEIAKKLKK